MAQSVSVEWNGDRARAAGQEGCATGSLHAAEYLLSVSQPLVPHEEGTLERSGRATSDGDGNAAVSYDTEYAVRQHEELGWQHPLKGQAKYLEEPFLAEQTSMQELIAAAIRRGLQ